MTAQNLSMVIVSPIFWFYEKYLLKKYVCLIHHAYLFKKNSSSLDKSFGIWDIRQSIVDEKGQYHSYIRNGVVSNSENFN